MASVEENSGVHIKRYLDRACETLNMIGFTLSVFQSSLLPLRTCTLNMQIYCNGLKQQLLV